MLKIISIAIFAVTLVASLLIGFKVIESAMVNGEPDLREYYLDEYDVRVKLEPDEHCVIVSQNPVTVKNGASAEFDIVFEYNYKLAEDKTPENVTVKSGKITVSECNKNTTLKLSTTTIADYYDFTIQSPDEEIGSVSASSSSGNFVEGTRITVKAIPKPSQTFIGWSEGATVLNGGNIVSYSSAYTFELNRNVNIYPNFLTAGYSIIRYHLNGGVLAADGTTDIVYQQFNGEYPYRLNPNAMRNDGSIVREGYTLLEFTDNQDGSGEFYTPGGIIPLKDGQIRDVYAQWSEWTSAEDFDLALDRTTGNYTITRYAGNLSTVSIPAEKDGIKITKIAAGAFKGKSLSTLIIPPSIVTVEEAAFERCSKLETLYISDSFTSFYDNAFKTCSNFKNLRLGAARAPVYAISESIAPRIDAIINRDSNDKPLIVFVGGSSCMYGFKAYVAEEETDGKYQFINAGTNASGCGLLYIEGLKHYMKKGDMFVNVPEYGNIQMGKSEIVWRTLRATESCYNIFSYVDFSKYYGFFDAMTAFNTDPEARLSSSGKDYNLKHGLTERYCDLPDNHPTFNKTYSAVRVNASSLSDSSVININGLIDSLAEKGIKYYFGCAPICHYNAAGTTSTDAELNAFYVRATEVLNCPVISHPKNYRYDTMDYNNSSYHLDTDTAIIHTKKLITDLLLYLD